jgi:hypothetical protein
MIPTCCTMPLRFGIFGHPRTVNHQRKPETDGLVLLKPIPSSSRAAYPFGGRGRLPETPLEDQKNDGRDSALARASSGDPHLPDQLHFHRDQPRFADRSRTKCAMTRWFQRRDQSRARILVSRRPHSDPQCPGFVGVDICR